METSSLKREKLTFSVSRHRNKIWILSGLVLIMSIAGLITSWLTPSIGYPLRPGLDFTGGTQIRIERACSEQCSDLTSSQILGSLIDISRSDQGANSLINFSEGRVQFLDNYQSILIRLPFLSAMQSKEVISALEPIVGPFDSRELSVDTIGPKLGSQLLKSSLLSLMVAFTGIALYLTYRFDRIFALLALVALFHDLSIVCGIFSWLGIFLNVEVNSIFAVSLLTISGYSVNDTVVVFDRIREIESTKKSLNLTINQKIDLAVSATLSRTIYTSSTTLLPLGALIFFGGATLFWFSIALALGVIVGSWSSIALAPSLLGTRQNV